MSHRVSSSQDAAASSAVPAAPLPHARGYLEPIGPPTGLINPSAFVQQSREVLDRANLLAGRLQKELIQSGAFDAVEQRCSVEDLFSANSATHVNENVRTELRRWNESRLFPAGYGPEAADEADEFADDAEDEVISARTNPGISEGANGGVWKSKDPEVIDIVAAAQASTLHMLKPIQSLIYYLRKTKTPDYNTLSELRNASTMVAPSPDPNTPLSSLIYQITIHPIPKLTGRSPFPVRTQIVVCLGSTTLWELRENILAGGDAIPDVVDEEYDNWGDERGSRKRVKWGTERRIAGSAFGVEGVLYADRGAGKSDYGEMIVSFIESESWSGSRSQPPEADYGCRQPSDANSGAEVAADFESLKPQWRIGSSMQATMLGDLSARIGEPHYFLHQGNCEHIWSIDHIRYIHPDDPKPLDSSSTAPYPITCFLSRLNAAKCRLCDRDPGSVVTVNDELAGETPALLCSGCFELLHGDNADGHVVVIPTLMEP